MSDNIAGTAMLPGLVLTPQTEDVHGVFGFSWSEQVNVLPGGKQVGGLAESETADTPGTDPQSDEPPTNQRTHAQPPSGKKIFSIHQQSYHKPAARTYIILPPREPLSQDFIVTLSTSGKPHMRSLHPNLSNSSVIVNFYANQSKFRRKGQHWFLFTEWLWTVGKSGRTG